MVHWRERGGCFSRVIVGTLFLSALPPVHANSLPAIRKINGVRQIVIDGKPDLLLGGELHNSSASSATYMAPIWDRLATMHIGTVIGAVSWQGTEPTEGQFNFDAIDAQVAAARKHQMHLILIWFGAFKNAGSTYAPMWIREDEKRFPRATVHARGREAFTYPGAMPKPVLSVFSPQLVDADRTAFTAMMRHLATIDPDHVVVMIQVENETGLLRDSRDRSAFAQAAWERPVPTALMSYLANHRSSLQPEFDAIWKRSGYRMSGSWAQVFGSDWQAEEIFMAWAFATYTDTIAKAGKRELRLPMYANAWIGPQPGQPKAGDYPSGGPVAHMIDVWKAGAPSLDLLAPDIYVPDVKGALEGYARSDNPVFTAEAQFRTGSLFWALGHDAAIGFSVFGIEDGRLGNQLSQAYALLDPMRAMIADAQASHNIGGVLLEAGERGHLALGGYALTIHGTRDLFRQMMLDAGQQAPSTPPPLASETADGPFGPSPADSRPYGLVIADGKNSFLLVGQGFTVDFAANGSRVEIDHVEEGRFDQGQWHPGRVLNGDERLTILPVDHPGIVRIKVLRTGELPTPAK
jgi:hypothetical protein